MKKIKKHIVTLTLITPGRSTSTILWSPGPLTLREIVCRGKIRTHLFSRTFSCWIMCNHRILLRVAPQSWPSVPLSHSSSSSVQSLASEQPAGRKDTTVLYEQLRRSSGHMTAGLSERPHVIFLGEVKLSATVLEHGHMVGSFAERHLQGRMF